MTTNQSNSSGETTIPEESVSYAGEDQFIKYVATLPISLSQTASRLRLRDGSQPVIERYLRELEQATQRLIYGLFLTRTIESEREQSQDVQIGQNETKSPSESSE